MKVLTCAAVRRRMSAFCDGELSLEQQVAIEVHLKRCVPCTAEVEWTRELGYSLRAASHVRAEGRDRDLDTLRATVLPRVRAERSNGLRAVVTGWFDDMRLVSIAGAGMAVMVLCTLLVFGAMSNMMLGSQTNPNSLAALVDSLSRESPIRVPVPAQQFVPPRVFSDAAVAAVVDRQGGEDALFAIAARVTRDGSLAAVEMLRPVGATPQRSATADQMAFDLLAAASAARFEPARQGGAPVSTDVVWVLTHTTVRGSTGGEASAPPRAAPGRTWPIGWIELPEEKPVANRGRLALVAEA